MNPYSGIGCSLTITQNISTIPLVSVHRYYRSFSTSLIQSRDKMLSEYLSDDDLFPLELYPISKEKQHPVDKSQRNKQR